VVQFVDTTCGTKKAAPSQVEGGFFWCDIAYFSTSKTIFFASPVPPT
jgi:hypothetical protein